MVEKLDGFDLQGDGDGGGGESIEGIDDVTLDWLRSLFENSDDESNDIVRQTNQIITETPKMSNEQNEMAGKLLQLNNPIGLQLSPPPYWMDSITNPNHARTIEAGVSHESSNQSMDSSDYGQQLMSYRLQLSPPPCWMDSITNPNHARTIEAGVSHESSNQSMDSSDYGQQLMSYRLQLSPPPCWMDSITNPNHARTIEAGVSHESSNQSMDSSDYGQQLMSYRLQLSPPPRWMDSITNPNHARTIEAGVSHESSNQSMDNSDYGQQLMSYRLQLSPPPCWMDSITNPNHARTIEAGVSHESSDQSMDKSDYGQQLMSYRLRASHFAALFIKIGEWQRASKNEDDLVAKFYFVKKMLVWEFLQGRLKYKIEIPWSDIIGINAVMEKNQPGILRIELNQPPTFYVETDPQPRRHAVWNLVKDFTGMQASIFRLHHLTFPCEYLDKHYKKLLLFEPRFFDLSKQSFPTLKNPFFHSNSHGDPGFAFDYNLGGQDSNLRSQFNFPNFPSHANQTQHFQPYEHIGKTQHVQPYGHNGHAQHFQPYGHNGHAQHVQRYGHNGQAQHGQPYGHNGQAQHGQRYGHNGLSSLKEMHSPASDSYNVLENQRMSYWDQGMSIYTDALARNQGLVPFVQSTQVHPTATFHNYRLANLGQEAVMNNNSLLGDIQAGNYHEKYRMEMIESLNKMVNLHKEVNPESKIASQETYEQQKFTRMPQIHPANPPTPQQRNSFPYDPVNNPNPTVDEFGNINNFKNNWS